MAVSLAVGTLVQNRYRIVEEIGRGGMGAVYQAYDLRLGVNIALKQMKQDEKAGEYLNRAFEREARLLAGLRHPTLPVVSDYFTDNGDKFLVMQFIPGQDLAAVLAEHQGPLDVERVLEWADQLLDVLDYLHTHDPPIIHRDIKPHNLKLTPRGEIVLLDFGLAKGTPIHTQALAGHSTIVYTASYAPLEQIQGAGTDPRSDLYALAATMYHLLTGDPPPNAGMRANEVLGGNPDPLIPAHMKNTTIPIAVSAALSRALELHTAGRPASAVEMRALLKQHPPPIAAKTTRLDKPAADAELLKTTVVKSRSNRPGFVEPAVATNGEQISQTMPASSPATGSHLLVLGGIIGSILLIIVLSALAAFASSGGWFTAFANPTPTAISTGRTPVAVVEPVIDKPTDVATERPSATPAPGRTVATRPTATATRRPTRTPTPRPSFSISAIEPDSVFVGTLPVTFTVKGRGVDQAEVAELVPQEGEPIPLEIQSASAGQVALVLATAPQMAGGETSYTLHINGAPQPDTTVMLRDYIELKSVQGVRPEFDYTLRVASDEAGTFTRMREAPDANAAKTDMLRNGDQVEVTRNDMEGWYQVRIRTSSLPEVIGRIWWIERWLVDGEPVPPTPTATPVPPTAAPVYRPPVEPEPVDPGPVYVPTSPPPPTPMPIRRSAPTVPPASA